MRTRNKILILIGILFLGLVVLNFGYFSANMRFLLRGRQAVPHSSTSTDVSALPKLMRADYLEIPSLDISAPVIYASEKNEAAYQKALKQGVVHFPQTALPGQEGNCYIFGHSSDYIWSGGKYKSVFATLPSIKKGDKILISDSQGTEYIYKVTDTAVVAANDLSVLSQETNGKKILTLQTSYPVGTALKRFIARAEIAGNE